MSRLRSDFTSAWMGWYCTELRTECPQCGRELQQGDGDLLAFVQALDEHADSEECEAGL